MNVRSKAKTTFFARPMTISRNRQRCVGDGGGGLGLELPIRPFAFGSARCSEFEGYRIVNARSKLSSSLTVENVALLPGPSRTKGRIARAGDALPQPDESELVVAGNVFSAKAFLYRNKHVFLNSK